MPIKPRSFSRRESEEIRRINKNNPVTSRYLRQSMKKTRYAFKRMNVPLGVKKQVGKLESNMRIAIRLAGELNTGFDLREKELLMLLNEAQKAMPLVEKSGKLSRRELTEFNRHLNDAITEFKRSQMLKASDAIEHQFPANQLNSMLSDLNSIYQISINQLLKGKHRQYEKLKEEHLTKAQREERLQKARKQFKNLNPDKKH